MTTLYPQVSLYIATHNITGLKYFGKTTKYLSEELLQQKYHGSGSDWKKHLSKYGDNVTMKLIGVYSLNPEDDNYVEPIALKLSNKWDIVKSSLWANRKLENGLDGGWRGYSKTDDELLLSKQKELKTKSSKEWLENVGYNQFYNHSIFMLNNSSIAEKSKETKSSKEWQESVGKEARRKLSETRLSKEWIENVGKEARRKEMETKSSKEWQENVWKPVMKQRSELVNSKEWQESTGVEKLKNMELHYLANCKHYDLLNALTNKVIKYDITPRDFRNWSGALINTSKEKYLGFSNRSKSKMIRDGKEKYIGLYIKERI